MTGVSGVLSKAAIGGFTAEWRLRPNSRRTGDNVKWGRAVILFVIPFKWLFNWVVLAFGVRSPRWLEATL